jgi:hypothetical protein
MGLEMVMGHCTILTIFKPDHGAPHILIVSPASARENNGNWQTASRWARFLRAAYGRVTIARAGRPATPRRTC